MEFCRLAPGFGIEVRGVDLASLTDADFAAVRSAFYEHQVLVARLQSLTADQFLAFARRIGVPADLLIDTGHPAGLRMIERGGFGDPASPKTAVLIECGQHWERSSADVAADTLYRFLAASGAVDASICKSRFRPGPPAVQRIVRVTEPVVAKSVNLRFPYLFKGLEVIPKAGTVVATDGDTTWRTPYDDCVMVMPSLAHVKPGTTVLRLGKYD